MNPEQEIQLLKQRIDMLEQTIYQFIYPDRYQFSRKVLFSGTKLGFFGTAGVARASAIGSPSIGSVSGTGDDTTINTNFTNTKTAVDSLRTAIKNIGISA